MTPYPNNINRATLLEAIDGSPMPITIVDEIFKQESWYEDKLLCLQRIRYDHSQEYGLGLGCYMLTRRIKKGTEYWAWGQFSPMITDEDFKHLYEEAQKKGWIQK